ncbi:MAG: hypothetical protein JWO15_3616 [Sphingomonadales bacterium]|nr:hypothetical protein [Sphingomonadales bacterium]
MPIVIFFLLMVALISGHEMGGCEQRQKTYDHACNATCKHIKSSMHNADKQLCVCESGKTFKYDINALYHE